MKFVNYELFKTYILLQYFCYYYKKYFLLRIFHNRILFSHMKYLKFISSGVEYMASIIGFVIAKEQKNS